MSKENKHAGAGDDPTDPAPLPVHGPQGVSRSGSVSARKASFFIGDAEGNKVEVKIIGPDEELIAPDDIVVPPDGGYGYVIVLAAFFSNVVVDGIVFSFGSLKGHIKSAAEANKVELDEATLAWAGSLLTGFYLLTGPFVSAIANRFGFRTVAILGSLIASGGFTIAWALSLTGGSEHDVPKPNITYLIVFYGIIGGIGFSCIYVPAVIAVGFYFEKKRALATGIAICGSGIGNFMFPPIIDILAKKFKWHGTILVLGLIVLVCAVMGLLYRPLRPKKSRSQTPGGTPEGTPLLMRIKRARDMVKWDSTNSFISNRESLLDVHKGGQDDTRARAEKLYNQARKYSTASLKGTTQMPPGLHAKRASVPTMLTTTGEAPSFPQAAGILANVPNKAPSLKAKSFVGLPDLHEIEEEHGSDDAGSRETSVGPPRAPVESSDTKEGEDKETASLLGNRNASIVTSRIGNSMLTVDEMTNSRIIRVASKVTLNKPLYRDDIFYSGSLLRIPDYANNVMTSTEWSAAVTRPPENDEEELPKKSNSCWGTSCEIVKKMLDFSLLLSPTFIVFSVSGMFTMLGMFVPFVYLIDQSKEALTRNGQNPELHHDISKLTFLLSIIGAANTVGRILSGWIADRPFVNALVLNNGAVTLMGIATVVVPLLTSYQQFLMFSCVFGISMACFASLRSILVVELLGLAKLTNAFGLLLLFQGIASMVATPIAGTIAKANGGKFAMAFYAAGGFILLSALMCYPLNRLNQWETRRRQSLAVAITATET